MNNRLHRLIYAARMYSWIVDPRRLRALGSCRIDRPIFLLGTQGGGLTLLSRMLRRHPEAISAAGNNSYWTAPDEVQNVFGLILPAELTGLRYKAPPHPVLTAPRSWTYAARDLYPIYRKTERDASPELAAALRDVICYCDRRYAGCSQPFRFVDKSQVFTVRLGLIHALLEESDPRFVFVTREPYISVYRAANGKAADLKRLRDTVSYEERVDICAEHYANSARAALEDARRLGLNLLLLKFEDLLTHPETTVRRVCEHVGLEYRADLLPAPNHRLPLGSRYLDRWFPLNSGVNEPYENKLDYTTISHVNNHFGNLVERLGYVRRETSDRTTINQQVAR